ncbi:MAG: pilus assembly protein TadG-related protein [Chloroflexota bacterium]
MGRDSARGQALAVLALSMTVILGATAMVIDGGNAMAQQRGAQNATDSAALAGTVVIAEKMAGVSRTDADVVDAIDTAFANNNSALSSAQYMEFDGTIAGNVGRGGAIPHDAAGVLVNGQRVFDTFLASIMGQGTWTAGASATAVAGSLRSICSAADGCGVMPVTFSIPITSCDGTGRPLRIGIDWSLVSMATALADDDGDYMAVVPLCKNGPGGVGWLEMDCGGNLADQIEEPCNDAIDIPAWIQSSTGNVNSVEDEMNEFMGTVITVPMFDSTCRSVPSSGLPADCTDPGNGSNLWYHIPRFAKFLLHEAHIGGGNHDECNEGPGGPPVGGNGGTGCFKGWFVRYIMQGRVGAYDPCDETPDCLEEPILGVQLIR